MKTMRSLSNTRGGFLHFILMIIIIIVLMNYFHISLSQILNFIIELLNSILKLFEALVGAVLQLAKNVPVPGTPSAQ